MLLASFPFSFFVGVEVVFHVEYIIVEFWSTNAQVLFIFKPILFCLEYPLTIVSVSSHLISSLEKSSPHTTSASISPFSSLRLFSVRTMDVVRIQTYKVIVIFTLIHPSILKNDRI